MAGMRYRLRTLLIVLALAPPALAGAWWLWSSGRVRWNDWAVIIDQHPHVSFDEPHSGAAPNRH
jgi:hypothetical protein